MSYLHAAFGVLALAALVIATWPRGPRTYLVDTAWLIRAMKGRQ